MFRDQQDLSMREIKESDQGRIFNKIINESINLLI
jgi:hypothetical protein